MSNGPRIILLTTLILSVFIVFHIKYKVQNLKRDYDNLNNQLKNEKEELHILKAEWAFLNEPKRLMKLVKKHLDLNEIKVAQIKMLGVDKISQSNALNYSSLDKNIIKIDYKPKVKWRFKGKTYLTNVFQKEE